MDAEEAMMDAEESMIGRLREGCNIMGMQEIQQILSRDSAYIKKTFAVKEFGVFGSYVRGEEKSGSDLDILVVFEKGRKDFFNYMRLKNHIEQLVGKRVDLVMNPAI